MSNRLTKRTLKTKEIIKRYEDGESTTEITTLANVSPRYIRMLLKDNNVQMRPRGSWKRKYTLNEDYFKTWSDNMAYILGFFIADGTVSNQHQSVTISQKEKYILEAIKAELGSNQPLYMNKKTGVYTLNLHSQIIKKDLIKLHGVKPNKSSTVEFPYIPSEHVSHFMRGYFDGDGYINYNQYTVTFVGGSKTFMGDLINILQENGFKPQLQLQGKNYRVHIRGRRTIKLFSNWIYKNKELYLMRKYNTFEKEKLELDQLSDGKHINTKEAVMKRKLDFLTIYAVVNSIEYACECIEIKQASIERWIKNDEVFNHNYNFLSKKRRG